MSAADAPPQRSQPARVDLLLIHLDPLTGLASHAISFTTDASFVGMTALENYYVTAGAISLDEGHDCIYLATTSRKVISSKGVSPADSGATELALVRFPLSTLDQQSTFSSVTQLAGVPGSDGIKSVKPIKSVVDTNGNIYLSALFSDFFPSGQTQGKTPLTCGYGSIRECSLIAKFDPNGENKINQMFSSTITYTEPTDLAIDKTGALILVGETDHEPWPFVSKEMVAGFGEIFISKFNSSDLSYTTKLIGSNSPVSLDTPQLALDTENNIVLTGISDGGFYGVPSPGSYLNNVFVTTIKSDLTK